MNFLVSDQGSLLLVLLFDLLLLIFPALWIVWWQRSTVNDKLLTPIEKLTRLRELSVRTIVLELLLVTMGGFLYMKLPLPPVPPWIRYACIPSVMLGIWLGNVPLIWADQYIRQVAWTWKVFLFYLGFQFYTQYAHILFFLTVVILDRSFVGGLDRASMGWGSLPLSLIFILAEITQYFSIFPVFKRWVLVRSEPSSGDTPEYSFSTNGIKLALMLTRGMTPKYSSIYYSDYVKEKLTTEELSALVRHEEYYVKTLVVLKRSLASIALTLTLYLLIGGILTVSSNLPGSLIGNSLLLMGASMMAGPILKRWYIVQELEADRYAVKKTSVQVYTQALTRYHELTFLPREWNESDARMFYDPDLKHRLQKIERSPDQQALQPPIPFADRLKGKSFWKWGWWGFALDALIIGYPLCAAVCGAGLILWFFPLALRSFWKKDYESLRGFSRMALTMAMVVLAVTGVMVLDQKVGEIKMRKILTSCLRYEEKNGKYPDALEDLVPDYQREIPDARMAFFAWRYQYGQTQEGLHYLSSRGFMNGGPLILEDYELTE